MAYLFAFETPAIPAASSPVPVRSQPAASVEQPQPRPELSALEWSVVALASTDRMSSLRAPGRFAIAMGGLFGTRHNPNLACPRLEALRRVAVYIWCERPLPDDEVANFTAIGFSVGHLGLIRASIARYEQSATRQRTSL
mgnify:CR=1 FL=1